MVIFNSHVKLPEGTLILSEYQPWISWLLTSRSNDLRRKTPALRGMAHIPKGRAGSFQHLQGGDHGELKCQMPVRSFG